MNHPINENIRYLLWVQFSMHQHQYRQVQQAFSEERKRAVLLNNPGFAEMSDIPDRKFAVFPRLRANPDTLAFAIDWRVSIYSFRYDGPKPFRNVADRIKPKKKRNGDPHYPMTRFTRFKLDDYELAIIERHEEQFDRIRVAAKATYKAERARIFARSLPDDLMESFLHRLPKDTRDPILSLAHAIPHVD